MIPWSFSHSDQRIVVKVEDLTFGNEHVLQIHKEFELSYRLSYSCPIVVL